MGAASQAPVPERGRHGRHAGFAVSGAVAAALVLVAYSDHFENGFHFDDHHVIVENLYIRSLHDVPRFFVDPHTFSTRPESASYRPLLTLSFALDYARGGGLDPRPFHQTQFALLVLLGLVLVPLYRRLCATVEPEPVRRWLALFAATLFAVHVANTETVNYLSSRSSLVATLGVVGSLALYVGWPRGRRTLLYLLPVLVGGLAKPLTAMFGPLLLLYRLLYEPGLAPADVLRPEGRRHAGVAFRASLPAWLASAAVFAFTAWMDADSVTMSNLDRLDYARTQPWVWLQYVRLFVVPLGLTADTDWKPVVSTADPRLWIGAAFLVVLGGAFLALASFRSLRPAAFGLGWFAIALGPTSSVIPLSEVYNEHRIFFPYVGLTLAATVTAFAAGRRLAAGARPPIARAGAALAIALLAAHAAGTHARNRVWRDELSLWEDVTRKSPANARGFMNYGVALLGRGYTRQALAAFERAHALAPDYEIAEINLALARAALGEPEVELHFLRALGLRPDYARGRYFYARWLVGEGRSGEAVSQLERALAASRADLDVRTLLTALLAARGDERRLGEIVRETLAIAPADSVARAWASGAGPAGAAAETAAAHAALARSRGAADDWLAAAAAARRAVELASGSAPAWNDLGWVRLQLGFVEEALTAFERALAIDPGLRKAAANARVARERLARR